MPSHSRRTVAALTALVAAVALASVLALPGCSGGGNKSTNPGGGGGGLELNSGSIGTSGQYDHRFFAVGTFTYHCTIHPLMPTGVITVGDGFPPGDTVAVVSIVSMSSGFSPANVNLHTGGHVTWTNNDPSAPHTVTSQ